MLTNRRERFRAYMARLGPAQHPGRAITEGLYVPGPGRSVADQVASRLELEPTSSHLIVGGVGSGKTTQLMVTRTLLAETPDVKALYIDVAEHHDLAKLQSGVLFALAGLALGGLLKETPEHDLEVALKQFRQWALGWVEWKDGLLPGLDLSPLNLLGLQRRLPVQHKGILIPPQPPFRSDIREKVEQLRTLKQAVAEYVPQVVMLFDSLDRLTTPAPFAELVEQDVRAIQSVGIGVVVVGPLHLMFGVGRAIADRFGYFYHQPSVDFQQDRSGQDFLVEILRRRATEDVLPSTSVGRIVELSGGVIRDLISLARSAGEEAYMAGADRIETPHVESAADAFGRTLMLGLGADEIEVLQRVRSRGTFVQTSDQDIALLVTRRVLEYGNGRTRYVVHPTILPLLEQLSAKA